MKKEGAQNLIFIVISKVDNEKHIYCYFLKRSMMFQLFLCLAGYAVRYLSYYPVILGRTLCFSRPTIFERTNTHAIGIIFLLILVSTLIIARCYCIYTIYGFTNKDMLNKDFAAGGRTVIKKRRQASDKLMDLPEY